MEEERIILRIRPAWLNYWGHFALAGMVLLAAFSVEGGAGGGILLALMIIATAGIRRIRYLFTVTLQRAVTRLGLIARNTMEIDLGNIQGITVRQGITDRILNIGDVVILSSADHIAVAFTGISNPQGVKETIRQTFRRANERKE